MKLKKMLSVLSADSIIELINDKGNSLGVFTPDTVSKAFMNKRVLIATPSKTGKVIIDII